MKVIIVNRRKLGVTLIMVGLMIILLGLERTFDSKIKLATLVQNNITSLKEYSALNGKFNYKVPTNWKTKEESMAGNEIVYHNNFNSEDNLIHGYIEVWNSNKDLKSFLDKSKEIAKEENIIKDYKITPITINKLNGYLVSYSMMTSSNVYFRCYEYFLLGKNKYLRFSFFVGEQSFKDYMPTLFKSIVETCDYKE